MELTHAPWTSYLVSVRTVEVPMFTEAETRLLLTDPMAHSSLWRQSPHRPGFTPEFWGPDGLEQIHREAGGWPHLVQLTAETVVDLMNDTDERHLTAQLMERALNRAVVRGQNVLHELMERESTLQGEWGYILGFRTQDTQPPPADEPVLRSLRRRLLIEEEGGRWHLRVPLMQRWLRMRC